MLNSNRSELVTIPDEDFEDGSCRHFPDGDATYRMVMAAIDLWKDNWAEAESVDVFLHDKKFLAEMDLFLPWPRDIKSGSAGCDCKNLFGQAFGRPLVFHHSLDHACMTKEAEVWGELVALIEVLAGRETISIFPVRFSCKTRFIFTRRVHH